MKNLTNEEILLLRGISNAKDLCYSLDRMNFKCPYIFDVLVRRYMGLFDNFVFAVSVEFGIDLEEIEHGCEYIEYGHPEDTAVGLEILLNCFQKLKDITLSKENIDTDKYPNKYVVNDIFINLSNENYSYKYTLPLTKESSIKFYTDSIELFEFLLISSTEESGFNLDIYNEIRESYGLFLQ